MRVALLSIALLGACSSPAPTPATTPPGLKTVVAEASPTPTARRSFVANGPAVAVETRAPVSTAYALSPDGLLLALFVAQGGGVAFYDVDRGIIVGRAILPRPPGELQFFEWVGTTRS
jgi:hypothetical protein